MLQEVTPNLDEVRSTYGSLDLAIGAGPEGWRDAWNTCADAGVFGLLTPRQYGGRGASVTTTITALEALGYACPNNGFTLSVNGQIWAVQEPILTYGSDAQKETYLTRLSTGALVGAHGMTEVQSGSDAASLATTAERRDGGYVLNGHKVYVGMASVCDLAVVFAKTAPDRGAWGISAFLVEKDDAGFQRGPDQEKMGLTSVPMGELHFKDCWIPEDRLLGREGAGASIFQSTMDWERSFIFASHVGSMARQLEECTAFARDRVVFGKPIAEHQSVSNRLADMAVRLETSRLMLYRAAELKDAGETALQHAAMTKLHISEAFAANSLDAMRIHGGAGYLAGSAPETDLRDALGGVIYSGTSDVQRQIIARMLKGREA
ncbi:MAG: acyl-CoA dehydrogenase family protein [Pseudomonadota bacterium]